MNLSTLQLDMRGFQGYELETMSFNIVSFGKRKENLLLAVQTKTIGSTLTTFKNLIKPGSVVFLHCVGMIWATAKVESEYFYSEEEIWSDKKYPHRFKITITKFVKAPVLLSDGNINTKIREQYGRGWAYRFIFSPKPLPLDIAQLITTKLDGAVSTQNIEKTIELH
ncbi:MAG: hypothetical protein IT289_12495 [Oligoflexia bacterium]|nr:hypothetical protein [Oligoflexia bacterium]